jgi:phosphodiesterase/alkaline phosphatase D-like protein
MNESMTRRAFHKVLATGVGAACALGATPTAISLATSGIGRGSRRVKFRYQRQGNVLLTWFRVTHRIDPHASVPFTFQLSTDRALTNVIRSRAYMATASSSHIVRGKFVLGVTEASNDQALFARLLVGEEAFPTRVLKVLPSA